jgi:xanthine/uracil permease
MSIDWASVNWAYVVLLSGFAFIAALIANLMTFGHRLVGAILTALLFAAVFVFSNYYPHGIALPTLK